MDAIALRASTQAGGSQATTTRTTNGPSSSTPTTGGGPIAAPTQPTLLGQRLLPAPVGEPQTIHLNDGSMLVPIARVDASGTRQPLSGGPGSAPISTTSTAPAAATAPAVATTAPVVRTAPAEATGGGDEGFEPLGFLYNDRYFKKFHDAGGIDLSDAKAVEERVVKSTFAYLTVEEPDVDDFGVTGVSTRPADPVADADLLRVNPRAHLVVDVHGVQGDGTVRSIPSVVNSDGAVFVDPRLPNR